MSLAERWPIPHLYDVRDALLAAWDRPGYHDARHLAEVLDRIDELDSAGERFDRVPVELAAWFHDAVYDGAHGDEERSAAWAERDLPDPPAAEVARLVRMTEHHRPDDHDRNGCVLSDADLGILAAGPHRYAEYVAGVRQDHAEVSDREFATGRRAVLVDLASKPSLFHTAAARRLWEADARANLAREIDDLARG